MMISINSTYRIIAIIAGILFGSEITWGAKTELPVAPQKPAPSVSVNEDSVKWRRDPFISNMKNASVAPASKVVPIKINALVSKKEQEPDIDLQGIMQTDNSFHALINGRNVKAGDKIGGGLTVKEISRFNVVFVNERKEKIIYDIYQGRIDRGKK